MNAIRTNGGNISQPDRLFIDGNWVRPSTESVIEVVAPATENVYLRVAAAQAADIERAVAAARRAFDEGPWPRMSHTERAVFLRALGAGLRERAADIAECWPNEVGILHSIAQTYAAYLPGMYDFYAGLADHFPFEEHHTPSEGRVGLLIREPVGVVGAIVPWNGPLLLITLKVAPALLAGCTVILKAAPEAPAAAYVLAEVAESVGLPRGVLNVIAADRTASEHLVKHPDVDKISFTGSGAAGKRIASLCGERVARVTLELGGKSAAIVFDDYDIAAASTAIVGQALLASGQVCSCLTRVIVNRSREKQLIEALSEGFASTRIGDPFDPATQMGPLAMQRQRERVEHYIEKGLQEGANLSIGGRRPAHLPRGYFIEPTVLSNVDNRSTVAQEEIFGPVLVVIPADDEEHAIALANDTSYGLNNSVFTSDADRAYLAARRLRSGTVGHNAFRSDFGIAFGGFKQSGLGREGGREGLLPYLESKTIILEGTPTQRRH